jgi:hypothetical protein
MRQRHPLREQIDSLLSDIQTATLLLPSSDKSGHQRLDARDSRALSDLLLNVVGLLQKLRPLCPSGRKARKDQGMLEALKQAALQMGYRPMPRRDEPEAAAHIWAKPVGFGIMLISELREHGIEWQQYFWHRGDAKPICWNRRRWPDGGDRHWYPKGDEQPTAQDFLRWIKECENWEAKGAYSGEHPGTFEFLTLSQQISGE